MQLQTVSSFDSDGQKFLYLANFSLIALKSSWKIYVRRVPGLVDFVALSGENGQILCLTKPEARWASIQLTEGTLCTVVLIRCLTPLILPNCGF